MQHNIRQDCIPFHVVHTAAGHMHSSGPCWAAGEMLVGPFPAKWGHGRACTAPRWAFPSLIFSPVRMDKFISRRLFFLQRDLFLQHVFLSLGMIHLFPFSKPSSTWGTAELALPEQGVIHPSRHSQILLAPPLALMLRVTKWESLKWKLLGNMQNISKYVNIPLHDFHIL